MYTIIVDDLDAPVPEIAGGGIDPSASAVPLVLSLQTLDEAGFERGLAVLLAADPA
jgi:hypothetical protein